MGITEDELRVWQGEIRTSKLLGPMYAGRHREPVGLQGSSRQASVQEGPEKLGDFGSFPSPPASSARFAEGASVGLF